MNDSANNDSLEEFESELSELRPRAMSPDLTARIARQLDKPARVSFADRCLMTFMGCGALAAMVIVGLLSWQMLQDQSPAISPTFPVAAAQTMSVGEYRQAFARSDGPTR